MCRFVRINKGSIFIVNWSYWVINSGSILVVSNIGSFFIINTNGSFLIVSSGQILVVYKIGSFWIVNINGPLLVVDIDGSFFGCKYKWVVLVVSTSRSLLGVKSKGKQPFLENNRHFQRNELSQFVIFWNLYFYYIISQVLLREASASFVSLCATGWQFGRVHILA